MSIMIAERTTAATKKHNYYFAATAVRYVVFRAKDLTEANAYARLYFQQLYQGRVYELVHLRQATHSEIQAHKEHSPETLA